MCKQTAPELNERNTGLTEVQWVDDKSVKFFRVFATVNRMDVLSLGDVQVSPRNGDECDVPIRKGATSKALNGNSV